MKFDTDSAKYYIVLIAVDMLLSIRETFVLDLHSHLRLTDYLNCFK